MFIEIFMESDQVHVCTEVTMPQKREEWTSNSYNEDSVMSQIIYPDYSNNEEDEPCESLSEPPSVDPTSQAGSELDAHALSELSAPTREVSMGHLASRRHRDIPERVRSTHIFHPRGAYQGGLLERHL